MLATKRRDVLAQSYQLFSYQTGPEAPKRLRSRRKRKEQIIIHSNQFFAPRFEACKILHLDTRKHLLKPIMKKSTEILLQQVDPRIRFTRNYEKITPVFNLLRRNYIFGKVRRAG